MKKLVVSSNDGGKTVIIIIRTTFEFQGHLESLRKIEHWIIHAFQKESRLDYESNCVHGSYVQCPATDWSITACFITCT